MTAQFINVNYEKGADILRCCKTMGYEEGEAAGFEKGEASGIVRGELSGELKVAGAMKAKGMTTSEICEITGLKRTQVEEV